MGRMTDLWKSNVAAEPRLPALDLVPAPDPDHDWFSGDEEVPFIEVGSAAAPEVVVVASAVRTPLM